MGNQKAQVYAGTETPTWPTPPIEPPAQYHRFPEAFRNDMDTLMGLRKILPKTKRTVAKQKAWDYIAETLDKTNEPITILSLGGFTNLGKMLTLYPDTDLSKLENVYTMGGAIWVDGNIALLNNAKKEWRQGPIYSTNWVAEWNMFVDPGAAKQVFQSAIPVTLIPLDACDYVMLDRSFIKTVTATDPIATLAKKIFMQKTGHSSEGIPVPILDPLATLTMAGAMEGAQYHRVGLDILTEDTEENNTCGQVYVVHNPTRKQCRVVQGVSEHQFAQAYAEIINRKIEEKK
jgi:purine nucleosidase